MITKLEQHYTLSPLHYTATLLDPRLKNNRSVLTPDTVTSAISSLKLMVDNVNTMDTVLSNQIEPASEQSPAKKAKLEDNFLCDIFASGSGETTSTGNEVSIIVIL